jgi:2-phospho-L-lactate/phosphoenolpyruvate guanylyltransferase
MARVLLPLKDLVEAKTRLSGLLRPSERRALTLAMVEDVLQLMTSHPLVSSVTLLSNDPGAHLLANNYGAELLPETELGCSGLNAVITAGVGRMLGRSGQLIVLHGDLPMLHSSDIDHVLALQQQTSGLVIGTDRAGQGTNMLVFDQHSCPKFGFGAGSCLAHRNWAQSAGVPVAVVKRENIAADIDQPEDFLCLWQAQANTLGTHTRELLQRWRGGSIETALNSLAIGGNSENKTMENL